MIRVSGWFLSTCVKTHGARQARPYAVTRSSPIAVELPPLFIPWEQEEQQQEEVNTVETPFSARPVPFIREKKQSIHLTI